MVELKPEQTQQDNLADVIHSIFSLHPEGYASRGMMLGKLDLSKENPKVRIAQVWDSGNRLQGELLNNCPHVLE